MINKRYEIIKKIGQGRSSVYQCKDTEFGDREIAIKILSEDAGEVEKEYFRNEFFTLQKLDHPNIIHSIEIGKVFETDAADNIPAGVPFITLEYFPSTELLQSEIIKNEESLKAILKQICAVLFYLHQSNYIYYDLKPENILVGKITKNPIIKLIDLGLSHRQTEETIKEIKGTAQYIAPELLKKEEHDHRVDLYSLGVLLYRIIYEKFPFDSDDELSIYKANIEEEFKFPESKKFSSKLIEVTKKLLVKEPEGRYQNSLQILDDIETGIEDWITKDLFPATVFSDRSDVLHIVSAYINDNTSSEVVTIKGFNGAGKSTVLNALSEIYNGSIKFSNYKGKSGIGLIKYLFREIVFSESVYSLISSAELDEINSLIDSPDPVFLNKLPGMISIIAKNNKFILLMDDFNLLDEFSIEILTKLIPILQIHSIKIILTETADSQYRSTEINNVKEILISSFTEVQVREFINESYSVWFPKEELITLILIYSDLLPGSIISFIKDLLLLKIIRCLPSGIEIIKDEEAVRVLKSSHDVLFDFRLKNLSKSELKVAQIISALDVAVEMNTLISLLDIPYQKLSEIIFKLQVNNVLQHFTTGTSLIITSDGFKKHIYSSIKNKTGLHLNIAEKIKQKIKSFNRNELARHYRLAEKYEACSEILWAEISEVERHSAYSYMRKMLEHLAELPLTGEFLNEIRFKLSEVYYKISDYQSALSVINSLEEINLNEKVKNELRILKSSALFNVGRFEEGKVILNGLLGQKTENETKQKILVEMAYADFEQKIYDEASGIVKSLLKDEKLSFELRGRCHNLLAMCYIYKDNDLNAALAEFILASENFKKAELPRRVAGVEVNVGNIFNILGIYAKAEEHWNKASDINQSIGNLEQEGLILLNTGIYFYNHHKFNKAVERYKSAQKVFLSLGNQINQGLVLYNLAELYMTCCEYQNVINSLQSAIQIFEVNQNNEELAEVLYLYGKLYYQLGSQNKLKDNISRFKKLLEKNNLLAKYSFYLRYLDSLHKLLGSEKLDIYELKAIKDNFLGMDERNKYFEANFTFIKVLIDVGAYKEALNELNDSQFIEIIDQNSILEAHREYLLSKIPSIDGPGNMSLSIDHLQKAYDLLKDENITDLTWKILLGLSDVYIERGNFNKARDFFVYASELINFIAENIQSPQLRKSYVNQKDVKSALEKIKVYTSA